MFAGILCKVCLEGHLQMAKLLLQYKLNLNFRYRKGQIDLNILTAATLGGNIDIVRLLLEKGAGSNTGNPLYGAVFNNNLDMV